MISNKGLDMACTSMIFFPVFVIDIPLSVQTWQRSHVRRSLRLSPPDPYRRPRPQPCRPVRPLTPLYSCTLEPRNSRRMNTCKSGSKQRTLSPFRMNTCEKRGGGCLLTLVPHRLTPTSLLLPGGPTPNPARPRRARLPQARAKSDELTHMESHSYTKHRGEGVSSLDIPSHSFSRVSRSFEGSALGGGPFRFI
jgi:hypothetical protein